jgi:ankyrin repeat protein
VDAIKVLFTHGADINTPANDGSTPVFMAAYEGRVDSVRLLLEHGVAVNTSVYDGTTPMFMAAQNGHINVLRLLVAMSIFPRVMDLLLST